MVKIRFVTVLMLLLGWMTAPAQQTQVRPCTEQDLPAAIRGRYIKQTTEFIHTFYNRLLYCVDDMEVQESFIESFMIPDGQRYMPEFVAGTDGTAQHLTPKQYLQELDKTFTGADINALSWDIGDLKVNPDDFYMFNIVSLYTIARYKLTLKSGEKIIFSRDCEAYCLFPRASVSIMVKLMQLNPTSQGTFGTSTMPQQKTANPYADMKVDTQNLPEPDTKSRVVSHHPDLKFNVLKTYTDEYGFWVDATVTNISDVDRKVTINTGLRAYDDAGNIYSELRKFSDRMCMYVGSSKQKTNWNAQRQSVILPSGVPVKVRILIWDMPKSAKGIRRLDWALYSDAMGMTSSNSVVAQLYDLYPNVADKLARQELVPDKPDNQWGLVSSSCRDLKLHLNRVRTAGGTCVLDFYIINTSRKDGWITPHSNIKVYDNLGNVYESGTGSRWGNPHLYVGIDKNPINWDGQTGKVKLPPNIPIKLRLELKGVDTNAVALTRILWNTFSEDFGTQSNRTTFAVLDVKLQR